MDNQINIKNLHPLELKVLRGLDKHQELTVQGVETALSLKAGNGNQALSWLLAKNLIQESRRELKQLFELTELGKTWEESGSPFEKVFLTVRQYGKIKLPKIAEVTGLSNKDVGSAFGLLQKLSLITIDSEKFLSLPNDLSFNSQNEPDHIGWEFVSTLKSLLRRAVIQADHTLGYDQLNDHEKTVLSHNSKKRNANDVAFKAVERDTIYYTFTALRDSVVAQLDSLGISGQEISSLSPELLVSGEWRNHKFRPYNIQVPPSKLMIGRSNPYSQFLEDVKDKLTSLGFEEFDGSLVETEFWNADALFMPQFHSARDIHDVYYIDDPQTAKSIEEPWLSRVAAAHENGGETGSRGWNYSFDRQFTKRLVLRSQGTVLSARQLPKAKNPGKYFGIVRCFRYDRVDATHLSDFYQTEGIVLGEEVNLRTLLGILEMFAKEVAGATDIKYVPGYFPFTEPSVEVHIKHPSLGWFELGGSGIFRPEVTSSLGVNVPVAAWGLGIDRMALMALGLNDLRELFSYDIENVRLRRNS